MKNISFIHSWRRLTSSLPTFIFLSFLVSPINVFAVTNTANCNIVTLSTALGIPVSDPDAAAVTGITLTGAVLVNSPTLGQYCEVTGNIKTIEASQIPVNSSDNVSIIQIAVKLPTVWNQKFLMYNGGGFDGSIPAAGVPGFGWTTTTANSPLSGTYSDSGGYVIAATDSGHVGNVAAVRNPNGTQNVAIWVN